MPETPVPHPEREHPTVRGHLIGITDSASVSDDVRSRLHQQGIDSDRVTILQGSSGLEVFDAMLAGSQWGEQAEKLRAQGQLELQDGHAVITIEVADAEEANEIAAALTPLGIRSLHHFGALIDTQLTA